jgi:hypothetical protein
MRKDYTMIEFTPPLKCFRCRRPATCGVYNGQKAVLRVGCPEHGYPWECSEQEQAAAVERYITWKLEGATITSLLRALDVIDTWQADIMHRGEPCIVFALWDSEAFHFDLWQGWYSDSRW